MPGSQHGWRLMRFQLAPWEVCSVWWEPVWSHKGCVCLLVRMGLTTTGRHHGPMDQPLDCNSRDLASTLAYGTDLLGDLGQDTSPLSGPGLG